VHLGRQQEQRLWLSSVPSDGWSHLHAILLFYQQPPSTGDQTCGQIECAGMEAGEPAVEWTWDGNDEMDPAQGRGWAVVEGDELHGMIFFHGGDDSEFVAKRAGQPSSKSKKAKR
jgi:hypothetical protein